MAEPTQVIRVPQSLYNILDDMSKRKGITIGEALQEFIKEPRIERREIKMENLKIDRESIYGLLYGIKYEVDALKRKVEDLEERFQNRLHDFDVRLNKVAVKEPGEEKSQKEGIYCRYCGVAHAYDELIVGYKEKDELNRWFWDDRSIEILCPKTERRIWIVKENDPEYKDFKDILGEGEEE